MPEAYKDQMKANGWWSEPEVSDEVSEAFRWYWKLNKWRLNAEGRLVLNRLTFSELLSFREVYDSSLDNEFLFEVVHSIDGAYLGELAKRQVSAG